MTFLLLGAAAIAAGVIIPKQLTPEERPSLGSDPAAEVVQDEVPAPVSEPVVQSVEPLSTDAPNAVATDAGAPSADVPDEISPDDVAPIVVEKIEEDAPALAVEPMSEAVELAPDVAIFDVRAAVADGCPAVHFGAEDGVIAGVQSVSEGEYQSSAGDDLCAIEFRLLAPPGQPYLAAAIERISGRYIESEGTPVSLRGGTAATGLVVWRINLPLRMKAPLEYRLHLIFGEAEIAGEVWRSLSNGNLQAASEVGLSSQSVHHLVSQ